MIRPATLADLPALLELSMECDATMHWSGHGLGIDKDTVRDLFTSLLPSPEALVSVVDLDGQVAGACVAVLHPYHLNRHTLMATELMWHMLPSLPDGPAKTRWFLRLLDHMRTWARERGAHVFTIGTRWGHASLRKSLERRGIKPFDSLHAEVLQ